MNDQIVAVSQNRQIFVSPGASRASSATGPHLFTCRDDRGHDTTARAADFCRRREDLDWRVRIEEDVKTGLDAAVLTTLSGFGADLAAWPGSSTVTAGSSAAFPEWLSSLFKRLRTTLTK